MKRIDPNEEVFLVFKVPRKRAGYIRSFVHNQPWYEGDDFVVADKSLDYLGVPMKGIFAALQTYMTTWKKRAAELRKEGKITLHVNGKIGKIR